MGVSGTLEANSDLEKKLEIISRRALTNRVLKFIEKYIRIGPRPLSRILEIHLLKEGIKKIYAVYDHGAWMKRFLSERWNSSGGIERERFQGIIFGDISWADWEEKEEETTDIFLSEKLDFINEVINYKGEIDE